MEQDSTALQGAIATAQQGLSSMERLHIKVQTQQPTAY
jgi:hypothetical protein